MTAITRQEFDALFKKLTNIEEQLNHIKLDIQGRDILINRIGPNISSLQHITQAIKLNHEKAREEFTNQQDSQDTDLTVLKTRVASLKAIAANASQQFQGAGVQKQGSSSQRELQALIGSLHALVNRTNERHIKEANISCNCTHTLLQMSIGSMRKHINSVGILARHYHEWKIVC